MDETRPDNRKPASSQEDVVYRQHIKTPLSSVPRNNSTECSSKAERLVWGQKVGVSRSPTPTNIK